MTLLDGLTVMAISNLISEQKITRDFLHKYFYNTNNYLDWGGPKRFFYDMISCWSCLTFHVSWIWMAANQVELSLQYIWWPLIMMMIVDVVLKIKR